MKSLIALWLLLCIASAFEIREPRNQQRERLGYMVQNEVVSSRIANGQTAASNQFPYQAGLLLYDGENYNFFGGSLISNEWMLTAAHCTLNAVKVFAYLGSIYELDSIVQLEVDKCDIKGHPTSDMETGRNDISLIKIPAVTYSLAVHPVSLPTGVPTKCYPTYVGDTVVASGWGIRDTSTSNAPVLQFANFRVISNKECAQSYDSAVIDDGKMCTAIDNRIGLRKGDSGSPLVLASPQLQIGIVSVISIEGCETDLPPAYTRVTSYLDWIRENTNIEL